MKEKYSEEFRSEAVSLALGSDKPYSVIARDLGVNYQTFGNWMRKAMSDDKAATGKRISKPDYQELLKQNRVMAKELKLRKQEIEILKKAAAYFAKHDL